MRQQDDRESLMSSSSENSKPMRGAFGRGRARGRGRGAESKPDWKPQAMSRHEEPIDDFGQRPTAAVNDRPRLDDSHNRANMRGKPISTSSDDDSESTGSVKEAQVLRVPMRG